MNPSTFEVIGLADGSPARTSKPPLLIGYVLREVDGTQLKSKDDFIKVAKRLRPGEKVVCKVIDLEKKEKLIVIEVGNVKRTPQQVRELRSQAGFSLPTDEEVMKAYLALSAHP